MCHQVTCKLCAKPTWAGCGSHIEYALAGVPKGQRCQGHTAEEIAQYRAGSGIFKRLFGR